MDAERALLLVGIIGAALILTGVFMLVHARLLAGDNVRTHTPVSPEFFGHLAPTTMAALASWFDFSQGWLWVLVDSDWHRVVGFLPSASGNSYLLNLENFSDDNQLRVHALDPVWLVPFDPHDPR